jgi:hypothetical protein
VQLIGGAVDADTGSGDGSGSGSSGGGSGSSGGGRGSSGGGSGSGSSSQPLPAALAAVQGVVLQTIASFDGYVRSCAQHVAASGQLMDKEDTGQLSSRSCLSAAEWLRQVFPDIHTICAGASVVAHLDAHVQAAYPSALIRLQAQLIAWAAKAEAQSGVTAAGSQLGHSTQAGTALQQQQHQQQDSASEACTTSSSSSSSVGGSDGSELPQPQPLPAALAAFQGLAIQTISSFDGFARSAAQRIAADPRAATSRVKEAAKSITLVCISRDGSSPGPLLALVQAAGPGSREQQALYSCLHSIVKAGAAEYAARGKTGWWAAMFSIVAYAAVLLLPVPAVVDLAGQDSTGSSSSAAAASSSAQSPAPSATAAATSYLPSLVLLGCCFQLWADQLPDVAAHMQQLLACADAQRAGWLKSQLNPVQKPVHHVLFRPRPADSTRFERIVQRVLDWLADSSNMQQLPALLQGLLAADAAAQRSWDGAGSVEAACTGLQAQLQAAGAALTALATPAFCNNPACQNVSGPTEQSLVSGRSCMCGGCCVARYCSRACQRAQWAQHKPVCKALAAAAAASEPAPAAAGGAAGTAQAEEGGA